MKRHIRLKEWGVSVDLRKTPSLDYSAIRDDCPPVEYVLRTDTSGFIISGNEFKSEGRPVCFLGDSFVESMFVDERYRFTSILERKLWQDGVDVVCLNGGYSGATSLHILNVIVNKVLPIFPKIVFIVVPSNDAFALNSSEGYWSENRVLSPFSPPSSGCMNHEFTIDIVRNMLEAIHRVLRSFGIRTVYLSFPHRKNYDCDDFLKKRYGSENKFNQINIKRLNVNECLRDFCFKNSFEFIDLEQIIDPFERYSQDDLHLSKIGSFFLADILYSWFKDGV